MTYHLSRWKLRDVGVGKNSDLRALVSISHNALLSRKADLASVHVLEVHSDLAGDTLTETQVGSSNLNATLSITHASTWTFI